MTARACREYVQHEQCTVHVQLGRHVPLGHAPKQGARAKPTTATASLGRSIKPSRSRRHTGRAGRGGEEEKKTKILELHRDGRYPPRPHPIPSSRAVNTGLLGERGDTVGPAGHDIKTEKPRHRTTAQQHTPVPVQHTALL